MIGTWSARNSSCRCVAYARGQPAVVVRGRVTGRRSAGRPAPRRSAGSARRRCPAPGAASSSSQQPAPPMVLGRAVHGLEEQVRPVQAGDDHLRVAQAAAGRRCPRAPAARRWRSARRSAAARARGCSVTEREVVGPEVVTPGRTGSAPRRPRPAPGAAPDLGQPLRRGQLLGGDEQEPGPCPSRTASSAAVLLLRRLGRADPHGAQLRASRAR